MDIPKALEIIFAHAPPQCAFIIALLLIGLGICYRDNVKMRKYNDELHKSITEVYEKFIDRYYR